MLDPYWMLLVHEMEHMEHYLDGSYARDQLITPQDVLRRKTELEMEKTDYPEVFFRKRERNRSPLWDKLEERETVIGAAKSELVLRLNAEMPIRYIYQNEGKYFLEDFDTVLKIVRKADSFFDEEKLEQFIEKNRQSYFMCECFHIIDTEFLPDALHEEFSLQEEELHSEFPKDTMKEKELVSHIIVDYESGKTFDALDKLCGKGSFIIKISLKRILSPGTQEKLREHFKQVEEDLQVSREKIYIKLDC